MLILIQNEPQNYAWGSTVSLPALLGTSVTGEPQAELWLGTHPGSPSRLATGMLAGQSLAEMVQRDPARYGVDGKSLPFLLKILAIEAPLSLQAHPSLEQAVRGHSKENRLGIPLHAPERNYKDQNHKPELLVALSDVSALSGFRDLTSVQRDLFALIGLLPSGRGKAALNQAISLFKTSESRTREDILRWALDPTSNAIYAIQAIEAWLLESGEVDSTFDPIRISVLRSLARHFPGDPGIFISFLLHVVALKTGEAIYLRTGELHAYVSGMAIEVMASSDNVLRGGLTEKHVDFEELCSIVRFEELYEPRIEAELVSPGLHSWDPELDDFRLLRATVSDSPARIASGCAARLVKIPARYPLTMIVTSGMVRIERPEDGIVEIVNLVRGQSLYVSAGWEISLSGNGEVFVATVGLGWKS